MKPLLSALNDIPEYRSLLAAIDNGACPAAFSGLSAVHRAHFAAGIRQELNRPVVVVCADEGEAERMARDLAALSGEAVRTLSAREFTFHNAAVVSRQYEHRRLSTLRALAAGECPLLVCTVESILQRTIPKTLLTQAAQVLRMGERHDLGELAGTLAAAGYTRCEQVEGVGQFALRGGILDFFSPAHPKPVRVEFFGDEIDAMGLFDPDTQRRIENLGAAEILPAAEVLPQFAPGGYGGLLEGLDRLISQAKRRKGSETLVQTLEEDRERPGGPVGQHGLPGHGPLHRPDLPRHGHGGGLLPRGCGGGAQREPPGGRAGKELPVAVGRGRQGPDGAGRAGRGAG